jgi:hypothetical protein
MKIMISNRLVLQNVPQNLMAEIKNKITINGVMVIFNISLSVGVITSSKPTEFTINYIKTLAEMAGNHLTKQIGGLLLSGLIRRRYGKRIN